jgi:hypothetical protein
MHPLLAIKNLVLQKFFGLVSVHNMNLLAFIKQSTLLLMVSALPPAAQLVWLWRSSSRHQPAHCQRCETGGRKGHRVG